MLIAICRVLQSLMKYPNGERRTTPVPQEKTIAINIAGRLLGEVTSLTVCEKECRYKFMNTQDRCENVMIKHQSQSIIKPCIAWTGINSQTVFFTASH